MNVSVSPIRPRNLSAVAALLIPTVCLFWAFWPTCVELVQQWNNNPTYSYGYLVPLFAGVLLWVRRGRLDRAALRPSWWGLVPLAAGLLLRLCGAFFYLTWFEELALLPCLAGLCVLAGGRAAWKWAWPSLLFLSFMIPLPYTVATMLSGPLQRLATICSAFVMQVFGMPAVAEGNVILLGEHPIDIVEACSGLRMLMVFFALAAAFVLLIRRPWPDKVCLLASAVPIALVSNIARIVLTGVLFETGVTSEAVHAFFHDAAGWLMMPFALVLLWAELTVLSRLLIDPPPAPVRTAREIGAVRRAPPGPRQARARKAVVREREHEREPSHAAVNPAAEG
jgi:exosortase